MNPREINKNKAINLINTFNQGFYTIGRTNMVIPSIKKAEYYSEPKLREASHIAKKPIELKDISVEVVPVSTVDAVHSEYKRLKSEDRELEVKVGVLNFASAKNPGGGFITGAMAQEEALCQASSLYLQLKDSKMYEYNRAMCSSGLYNDSMNVSETIFIKDSRGNFVMPSYATVVTSAAVNHKALKRFEYNFVDFTMKRRMEEIIKMFIRYNCKVLILGAFGCGVFGNDPKFVAETWRNLLSEYGGYFEKVVFAVMNRKDNNFEVFKDTFEVNK